jgi:periplasmic protein TonB
VALLLFLGANKPIVCTVQRGIALFVPVDLAPLPPNVVKLDPSKSKMGGGGGGGDRSALPSSIGRPPKFAARQFVPPVAEPSNLNPTLIVEPTIVVQPDAPVPNMDMAQIGNPWGVIGPPSNGRGKNGGIGEGEGGGDGPGDGPGLGPGEHGNTGGGPRSIGAFSLGASGITGPVLLFQVEPEYSEEARKAKFQGTVMLSIIIDRQGRTRDIRVVRELGLGLDQKAVEAVSKWRFKPGQKGGTPVNIAANVEVNFRLL